MSNIQFAKEQKKNRIMHRHRFYDIITNTHYNKVAMKLKGLDAHEKKKKEITKTKKNTQTDNKMQQTMLDEYEPKFPIKKK